MSGQNRKNTASGFSLIEALIVVTIVSVLVVFSVAQFGNADRFFKVHNVARDLKVKLERARFDSVKRRPYKIETMSRVVIESETSFTLINDLDEDGILEPSDERKTDFSGSGIKIVTKGISFPITIVFDRRGKTSARDSAGVEFEAEFVVCENCTFDSMKPTDFLVSVSRTGTITMLSYGESLQTFASPTTTSVAVGADVNPLVSTNDSITTTATVTPTPFAGATPTPAPTATATPTPAPTATATPGAAPTATPTPSNLCKHNQKPSETGCICQSPMTLHRNGQCKS